jgi:uncharacterized protein YcfJ
MFTRFHPLKIALAALCASTGSAWATEYGTVLTTTPLVMSVPVPQRECADEAVVYQQPNTGAGALIGAIAGAAVGNAIGSGGGRAAATGIGLIAGSVIGDRVEGEGRPPVATTQQRCRTVTRYEQRTVGYDVVYEYQGVRRTARLAQDPGERIALELNVAPVGAAAPVPQAPAQAQAPVQTVYEQPPVQTVYVQPYYPAPYYYGPSVYVNPWPLVVYGGYRYGGYGGYGGHGHRR